MSSPLFFRIYKHDQIHVVKQFINEERIVVGQGPGAQIDLHSPEVSSVHCVIEKRDDAYYLCDMGSEHGTFVNGKAVLDQPIASGDAFQIGPFNIYFLQGNKKNIDLDQRDRQVVAAETPVKRPAVHPTSALEEKATVRSEAVQKITASRSSVNSLKEVVRAGSGSKVEVIVSWRERIINTYHFSKGVNITIGNEGDVVLPTGTVSGHWTLIKFSGQQMEVNLANGMRADLLRDGEWQSFPANKFVLKDADVAVIDIGGGLQLALRFAPKAPIVLLDSPFVLGITEFTGVLAALILAVIVSLIVAISKPKNAVAEEQVERLAKVVFDIKPPPIPIETVPEKKQEEQLQEEIKKVQVAEKQEEKKEKKLEEAQKSKAAALKPADENKKAKMFTSTKQVAAIKTSDKDAASAKSKEPDPKNSGLLAAFGSGGSRTKLDKAYTGAGELLGAGEKATGSSGFNSNRDGDDLGSKAKDTGVGGAGTATQGISGVGTQGRGTGMTGAGVGTGFGDKGKINIEAGGNEETFSGTIDREAVRRVVKSALAQFKACYEREYRMNSKLEGKVVVQWEIHEQGVAKNASIIRTKSTINNSAVEECVKNRMVALKFPEPPPGTAAEVTYPFIFQGQKL